VFCENPLKCGILAVFVIASQRVRANARPDDRLREAIQIASAGGFWIASSLRSSQ
jgi:hypothetical protein